MKIIDNRSKETTKNFGELKIGDTFCTTQDDRVFMKTESFYSEFDDGHWVDRIVIANAFCLNDGKKHFFGVYDKVIPLTCECVIVNK